MVSQCSILSANASHIFDSEYCVLSSFCYSESTVDVLIKELVHDDYLYTGQPVLSINQPRLSQDVRLLSFYIELCWLGVIYLRYSILSPKEIQLSLSRISLMRTMVLWRTPSNHVVVLPELKRSALLALPDLTQQMHPTLSTSGRPSPLGLGEPSAPLTCDGLSAYPSCRFCSTREVPYQNLADYLQYS